MCTTGAIILAKDDYILFKNKDFAKSEFSDHLLLEPQLFGVRGLETFGEQEVAQEVFSGLSVGANQAGLLCCDSHVNYSPSDAANYDKLVEVALRQGDSVATAVTALEQHLKQHPSWAGNLVLTDGQVSARVEARGDSLQVEYSASHIASTNHQYLFASDNPEPSESSTQRLQSARDRLARVQNIEDIFKLLSSHDRGESGVCNHQVELKTVYSYVLRCRRGEVTLYVTDQQPCEAQSYQAFILPLGSRWSPEAAEKLIASYPS